MVGKEIAVKKYVVRLSAEERAQLDDHRDAAARRLDCAGRLRTGYSSLTYLRQFRFDRIKIDQTFVSEMTTRSECAAIVVAVAGLARSLGVDITAEGIELQEQLTMLQMAGCTDGQGYLICRPTPANEAVSLPPWRREATLPSAVTGSAGSGAPRASQSEPAGEPDVGRPPPTPVRSSSHHHLGADIGVCVCL